MPEGGQAARITESLGIVTTEAWRVEGLSECEGGIWDAVMLLIRAFLLRG